MYKKAKQRTQTNSAQRRQRGECRLSTDSVE